MTLPPAARSHALVAACWLAAGLVALALTVAACDDDGERGADLQGPPACVGDDACAEGARCVDGQCTSDPCACSERYDPVCGADGRTWGNLCKASCAGVAVVRLGACTAPCTTDSECRAGQSCTSSVECQEAPAELCGDDHTAEPRCVTGACWGRCVDGACGCSDEHEPVCGRDGVTYDNACRASCAGTVVASSGECPLCPPLGACDLECPSGLEHDADGCPVCACAPARCEVDEDCVEPLAERCDPETCVPSCAGCDDCVATCVPRSLPCSCEDEPYAPVCTTDGRTLRSACVAQCQGAEIAHAGPCSAYCEPLAECYLRCPYGRATDERGCPRCACAKGPRQLCQDGRDCGASQWCNPAACVGPECMPACEPMPCSCPKVWRPVCDATGWTWGSACEAECVGVESARLGACEADCACPPGTPVCGADGRTHASACQAACEGVEVIAEGGCDCDALPCDGPGAAPVCAYGGQTFECAAEAVCRGARLRWSGTCEVARRCKSTQDCGADEYCRFDACAPSCVGCDDCGPACVPR